MSSTTFHSAPPWRVARGMTLIELMVALVIGLTLTLAMTMLTIQHERGKRELGSANDMSGNANFVSYELDRLLRSAGTGYIQGWSDNLGCPLRVSRNAQQLLPRLTPLPAPFAALPLTWNLAPVLVFPGAGNNGSDALAIMTGTSGLAETVSSVQPGSTTATSLRVPNTVGIRGGDLLLVAEQGRCLMQEVASPFAGGATQALNFGGMYASPDVAGVALASFATNGNATAALLGNAADNRPLFQLLGLNASSALVSYDLLQFDTLNRTETIADGIADLRVLYGIDSNMADNVFTVNQWVAPTDPNFTPAALTAGTPAAQTRLLSIMAVRVALVLRSDRIEKEGETVSAEKQVLFRGMPGLERELSLSATQQRQRHRVVEFTVPLRNVMITVRPPPP
ncbi:MAG: PilW family protein [Roseateles asaccharophilus]|uniref:PilW family protein n=1 Tax=Roseateles asaccharophilus TaxID=582607 RepID=UPI00391A8980